MEVLVWGLYKQRISHENVLKEWAMLSWAAKWLFDDTVMSGVVSSVAAINRDDSEIIQEIWDLLNEADIIIAHNAAKFDVRKLNARFITNHLPPPLPYQVIDTLKVSQRHFAFSSHKLDFLTKMMGLSQKLETNYGLWKRCVAGDSKALDEMVTYNRSDVVALEELYVNLRPWIKSHPNMGLYYDKFEACCPNCGSTNIDWLGLYTTPAGQYQAFRCKCGAIGRDRHPNMKPKERSNLTISVAR